MLKCVYCQSHDFEAGKGSEEHVILSSIGGRKTSRNICCIQCNQRFGKSIDKQLSEKFITVCSLLGVKRDRKPVGILQGVVNCDDSSFDLYPDGKAVNSELLKKVALNGDILEINVTAATEQQALRIAQGLLKKHGQCVDDATISIEKSTTYLDNTHISLYFSWDESDLRSVAKRCLNYLVTKTDPHRVRCGWFDDVIGYINGNDSDASDIVFMDTNNFMSSQPRLSPRDHRIFLYASSSEHICLAQIELFGAFPFSVLLSRHWGGPDLATCHVIDPVTTKREEFGTLSLPSLKQILANRGSDPLMAQARRHCLKLYLEASLAERQS